MRQFDSYTVDELREIVDPDRPETLQQQSEGWGDMAVLLQEYSRLLEQRLEMVEKSWTGEAATLYFDEVKRVKRYVDESAERATTNSVLWCTIALMAGIAKHDVSHIHKLWKNLDSTTDAVGLGFILAAFGVDKTVENLKRMPYDEASRQIMDATMAVAEESYAQMREFEDFTPPPSVDGSGPQLQSVHTAVPPGGATVAAPPTTVVHAPSPLAPMPMRPVVSPVIGTRPGMFPAQQPLRGPGATVRPVIGQRQSTSGQAAPAGKLIGRYGVVSSTRDVDLRDPQASRAQYGGGDVNRGVIGTSDDRPTTAESRLKLEEEVLRLRERAFANRAEALSAGHSQHVLPGIVGNDAEWEKAPHDPGTVMFEGQRRHHNPDDGWKVF